MTVSSLAMALTGPGRTLLIASAFLATFGQASANPGGTGADIEAQNKTIVRTAFETWRTGGNVFAELLSPDVVWTIAGSDEVAGTYRGLEDFVGRASAPLVSRLATPIVPEVHSILADGDTVIVRFDGSATTTSGAAYTNQFVWIFTMKEGRVVEAEAFLDLAAYRRVVENNAPRTE